MRYLLVLVFASLLVATPAIAQNTPDDCDIDEAQAWYDGLDENNIFQSALTIAADSSQRLTDRAKGPAALEIFYDLVEEMDYPDCVEVAREQYLESITEMQTATESLVNATTAGDYGEFAILFGRAMQSLGEFRGYLTSLGLEVFTPSGATLFFK